MLETPPKIPCPNCEFAMDYRFRRKQRIYRHSEDMHWVKYICPNMACNTHYELKYSAKTYKVADGGVKYDEREY